MEGIQSIQSNQVNFKANDKTATQTQTGTSASQIENGDEKSMNALKWAGIIAGTALLGFGIYKGVKAIEFSKLKKLAQDAPVLKYNIKEIKKGDEILKGIDKESLKIGDKSLTFEKGVASLGGEKYTGAYNYNGKIVEYKDGILKRSFKLDGDSKKLEILKKYNEKGQFVDGYRMVKDGEKLKKISSSAQYDDKGRLTSSKIGDKSNAFEYGENGKVSKATIGDDTFEFGYDNDGKLTSKKKNGEALKIPDAPATPPVTPGAPATPPVTPGAPAGTPGAPATPPVTPGAPATPPVTPGAPAGTPGARAKQIAKEIFGKIESATKGIGEKLNKLIGGQ